MAEKLIFKLRLNKECRCCKNRHLCLRNGTFCWIKKDLEKRYEKDITLVEKIIYNLSLSKVCRKCRNKYYCREGKVVCFRKRVDDYKRI